MIGFRWEGENKFNAGIVQATTNKRIIDGQSVSYGTFSHMIFMTTASQNVPLIDLDYNGIDTPGDLRPQNITFTDCVIAGQGVGHIGVQIAKSGGGSQGDNIRFLDCYLNGFNEAAVQLGGGPSLNYAFNAIHIELNGGDIQSCPKYGLAAYGGSFLVRNMTFENGNVTFPAGVIQTGWDLFSEASQNINTVENVRSESIRFAVGWWKITNCTISGPTGTLSYWPTVPGTASFLGQVVTGSPWGGDGKFYVVTANGTWGGVATTAATGGSATTIVKAGAGWTNNAFVGQRATIISGAGKYQYGIITGNDATTITVAAGWVTDFVYDPQNGPIYITNPNATSTFTVEPNWPTNPTTSGTVTFAVIDFNVVAGDLAGSAGNFEIDGFTSLGGRLLVNGNSTLRNVIVSRTDFLNAGGACDGINSRCRTENVYVVRPGSTPFEGSSPTVPWRFPNHGAVGMADTTLAARNNEWFVWDWSDPGGGTGHDQVGIGRGDGAATGSGNATSRNVLGIRGTLGRKTPFGTNQAGENLNIQGGLSTGTGSPGAINFYIGAVGSTGTTTNAGAIAAGVGANRLTWLYKGGDVASAAAIVPTGNLFHVTGTTNITSITSTGITAGTRITIIFDGVLTFTDGGNLVLAGNFVTTANDVIVLEFDGTNWYEASRSVN